MRRFVPAAVAGAALALFILSLATAPLAPLFDPDEGYYAATASETLATGSPWDLRFNNQPRWEKPPLAYALIEGAFALAGNSREAARLPSAVEGALLVLIVGVVVSQLAGPRAGSLSAGVVATTLGVQIFARAAHPEIAVVLAIVTTELLLCLWFAAPANGVQPWLPLVLGVALAYGILAKGPVALVLPGLMALVAAPLVAWGRARWIAGVRDATTAVAVALALATPWYAAMTIRHGLVFLREALWNQNVARFGGALYGHHRSMLYFVLPTVLATMPWTALMPLAFVRVFRRDDSPRRILRACAAAAFVTAFAFYSASASKLASYALVFVPPLAILVGLYLDEETRTPDRRRGVAEISAAIVLGALGVALLSVPLLVFRVVGARTLLGGVPSTDPALTLMLWRTVVPPAALLIGAGAVVATASRRVRVGALFATGALFPVIVIVSASPMLRSIYPWESFGRHIRADSGPVWIVGYRAPSLNFHASRAVEQVQDMTSLERELERPSTWGWLVVDAQQLSALARDPAISPTRFRIVDAGGRMRLVRVSQVTGQEHHGS